MFEQPKWLAVIQGNHWVVAKVKKVKAKLKILKIAEYTMEMDSSVEASLNLLWDQEEKGFVKASSQQSKATDTSALSLRQWLQKEKVPLKRLNIAFSCQGVITRMITLPLMPVKDLNTLLTEQVDQYFTLNIEDYVVDYRIIDFFEEEGQKRQHVLLAALPKYQWEPFWNFLREAGIKPKAVDLSPDCLSRLYGLISIKTGKMDQKEQPLFIEDLAIIDLGRERIEFVLLEKGLFFLYSDLQLSLEDLRQTLANHQEQQSADEKASFDSSNPMLLESDSMYSGDQDLNEYKFEDIELQTTNFEPASYEFDSSEQYSTETYLRSTEAYLRSEVESALMPVLRTLEEFMNFFAARHFGKPIDHIYITGEYADLPFLHEIFKVNLEVVTSIWFPGGWQASFGKRARDYSNNWMKYGILYGLALRED